MLDLNYDKFRREVESAEAFRELQAKYEAALRVAEVRP